jgi:uncharacterized protein YegJ (DUF2314 family)
MPSIDPKFVHLSPDNAEFVEVTTKARALLPYFRNALSQPARQGRFCGVKIHFPKPDGADGYHIWLTVNELFGDLYFCSPIELPQGFPYLKLGESKIVADDQIEDWMILENGILHGGLSLRLIRRQLSPPERVKFDEHMGVTEYAE